jgi:iduronate 2-sulfatase
MAGVLAADENARARPNVLFVAIDDLRPSLGCYGDPIAQTPHIDALAAAARQFNRAYCQQAVCGPSRASLLTGRLPAITRVWHNRDHFRNALPNVVTLPQLFKNNGYHTQSLGKVFSGDPREEDPQSWSVPAILRRDGWRNYALRESEGRQKKGLAFEAAEVRDDGYTDGKLANLAVRSLEELKSGSKPFFLAVGFFKPHLPFNAPRKYWDLYDPAVFDLTSANSPVDHAPDVAYHTHRELGGYTNVPADELVSAEQARQLRHGYYACLSYVDAQVGKLLAALERLKLAEDTIVVLWGDHGFALGEGRRWCKGTNFELDTRVPLIVRTPGMAKPGVATEALTELVDIYPTLAALAGLSPPANLDGQSLVPILNNPKTAVRNTVLSQFPRPFKPAIPEAMGYSIRNSTHRYTRWIKWDTRQVIAEELYDYNDPESARSQAALLIERRNIVKDAAHVLLRNRLRARMDEILAARTANPTAPNSRITPGALQRGDGC